MTRNNVSIRTLKAMQKAGLITFHPKTGTKITGLYGGKSFTCTYIDDSKDREFEFKGKIYVREYVSGCFCPYLFEVTNTFAAYKDGKFCFITETGKARPGYTVKAV